MGEEQPRIYLVGPTSILDLGKPLTKKELEKIAQHLPDRLVSSVTFRPTETKLPSGLELLAVCPLRDLFDAYEYRIPRDDGPLYFCLQANALRELRDIAGQIGAPVAVFFDAGISLPSYGQYGDPTLSLANLYRPRPSRPVVGEISFVS